MSIKSASVPLGGTYSATGGTATPLLEKGTDGGTLSMILDNDAELTDQISLDFRVVDSKANASSPNGWTQSRNFVAIKQPVTPAGGDRTVNTVRIEISRAVGTTAAELSQLRELAVHALIQADFDAFYSDLSKS